MAEINRYEGAGYATIHMDGGTTVDVPVPSKCPICEHFSQVTYTANTEYDGGRNIQVVYQCGYGGCKKFFVATYYWGDHPNGWTVAQLYPKQFQPRIFTDAIKNISDSFVRIYGQADQSLSLGLDQVAGPGFRKAAEFLIKDYAILKDPGSEKAIKQKFVGNVVKDFIDDPRVKSVAERALWIGNDETHYLKKWETKDISDLKRLIELTLHYIEMESLSAEYVETMPGTEKERNNEQ